MSLQDLLTWLAIHLRPVVVAIHPPSHTSYAPWVSAGASFVTACVAVLAYRIARNQLAHAKELRDEQAAPYVVASLELGNQWNDIKLVVQNLGKTLARDVDLEFDPAPLASRPTHDDPHATESVPVPHFSVLVPGQIWSTHWDYYDSRERAGLPTSYAVTVRSSDASGRPLEPLTYRLDWAVASRGMDPNRTVERHLESIAGSLRKVERQMQRQEMDKRMRGWRGGPDSGTPDSEEDEKA